MQWRSPAPLLRVTGAGADLLRENSGETLWSIQWVDLEEIVAFQTDALTCDRICLAFRRAGDSSFMAVDEDTRGWNELNDQLALTFGISVDEWFGVVAFPPLAENRTILWTRAEGSLFPTKPLVPL